MENIAILGSTGSIGENTLAIVRTHPKKFRIRALAANRNVEKLAAQAKEFRPSAVCLFDPAGLPELRARLKSQKIRILTGEEGLNEISSIPEIQKIIFAMVGACGLKPILTAVRARKAVAIANKEPLVMAGALLMKEAKRLNVPVLPIDSEHSGLWQCLHGQDSRAVKRLVLTSTGGPFRNKKSGWEKITPARALKHPKWKMGAKITIDSATLMNKGLEVIEASNLFGVSPDQVGVLIHPEAVVHAMVELVDGSHLAHLGITDMRLPIQYAMSYPERLVNHLPTLDLVKISKFHFYEPDRKRFPCLELGYEAGRTGETMPAALNAANEVAVSAFLRHEIPFEKIPKIIDKVMHQHRIVRDPSLDDILQTDQWSREAAEALL